MSTWRRLRRIWLPSVRDDVDDEVAFHFQMRVEQFIAAGMSREAAERAAREKFGDVVEVQSTLIAIDSRRRRHLDWRERFDALRHDVVVSTRALRREPLFTLGVVMTLALGLGANATMFGIIDRLMLRGPNHVADARSVDRLYITRRRPNGQIRTESVVGYITYTTLRDRARALTSVGAYTATNNDRLGAGRQTVPVQTAYATWDLFPTLGVRPVIGRFYGKDEDSPPRGADVAVVSEELWRAQLGGVSSILGQRITINDAQYTVIGVAPSGFTGPELVRVDVWQPMTRLNPDTNWPTTHKSQWLRVVGRRAPHLTAEQAGAEATTLLRAVFADDDESFRKLAASFGPLWYARNGQPSAVANVARWLMGVAAIVLLVTCANVANLLIARARRRRREVAVRLALGAGRARVVRLLLTETLVVVLAGAAGALLIALGGARVMRATLLSSVAWDGNGVDVRVLAFTFAVAIATGLAIGLAPAIGATRSSLVGTLKAGAGDGGGRRARARAALSALQAALCVVLLIGAGLFVESLMRSRAVNLGIDPSRVLRAYVDFDLRGLTGDARVAAKARNAATLAAAADRIRVLPWVERVGLAVGTPFGLAFSGIRLAIPGRDSVPKLGDEEPFITAVDAGYFPTVRTPLRAGRTFTTADRAGSPAVVILNETMANVLWPGESAVGKCIEIGDAPAPCAEVVGIVADAHRNSLREPAAMQYYVPLGQEKGFGGTALLVRSRGDGDAALPMLERALRDMSELPPATVTTIRAVLDPQYRPWKLGATMFGVFGILALVIAAVGLYSVIAYLVADRTRELGVRIALGATSGRIVRQVVGSGLAVTATGVAIGIAIALVAGRSVEPLLFDMSAKDPVVMTVVAIVVLSIGAFASWRPARRAAGVDPVVALRSE